MTRLFPRVTLSKTVRESIILSLSQPSVYNMAKKIEINSVEWTVRTCNVLDKEKIAGIKSLVKRCVSRRTFVELPCDGAGLHVNFEIAQHLLVFGFLKNIEGVKRPSLEFPLLTTRDLAELSEKANISFETKLASFEWDQNEICFIRSLYYSQRLGNREWWIFNPPHEETKLTLGDLVLQVTMKNSEGKVVFRTWKYDKSRGHQRSEWYKKAASLMEDRLRSWNII